MSVAIGFQFEDFKKAVKARINEYKRDRETHVRKNNDINEIRISIESLKDKVSDRNLEPLRSELDDLTESSKESTKKHDESLSTLQQEKARLLEVMKDTYALYISVTSALKVDKIEDPMLLKMARLLYHDG